ncbi:HD domain-containing protein [Clostridium sediminicola]|uniref:HD domain-containing protein n=1 Tax=Clostridium sediminicola TaxID=3114879 RepID=UPI0031F1F63E
MDINTFNYFKSWFSRYVESFYCEDEFINENITLKLNHTIRVVENSKIISQFLKLTKEQSLTAEVTALFHDIGRFEQFKTYKTFNDKISEDHASLGISILNNYGILNTLDNKEKNIILFAVYHHNKFSIPKINNINKEMICKITRDADKLDILKIVTDYYATRFTNSNPAIEHNLVESNNYSSKIVEDIFKCQNSKLEYIETSNDCRLMKLTWIFDIYFPKTLLLIKERNFIQKTMEALPKTDEMDSIQKHLLNYIDKKTIS